ncbi:hypothetical protein [Actinomadura flavalba]|uniref:hypothetical protein n=1 Tax=Actinomadura flavalba TaxID=1120938 RepID=UPI000361D50C|nr:hypothetical protein [Actinomadura flavalba]
MPVSAALCPHPPLLVPELAGAAAPELDALRAACATAVAALPADVVIVGGGPRTRVHPSGARGTLRPYGLDLTVGARGSAETREGGGVRPVGLDGAGLPLSLTIGRWLLGRDPAGYREIAVDATPDECARVGADLASSTALLVMADGSACRSAQAPGHLDPRAEGFDASVAGALRRGDAAALAALDPALCAELGAAGRAAWQVLAGAATGAEYDGVLHYDEAPYGVGYLVAGWRRR